MRWKSLGYAAALLYNAALWVFWARAGWKLADAPRLYLVPVGFSTILFAEANRRELGRPQVNAVRGVGLMLVYFCGPFRAQSGLPDRLLNTPRKTPSLRPPGCSVPERRADGYRS